MIAIWSGREERNNDVYKSPREKDQQAGAPLLCLAIPPLSGDRLLALLARLCLLWKLILPRPVSSGRVGLLAGSGSPAIEFVPPTYVCPLVRSYITLPYSFGSRGFVSRLGSDMAGEAGSATTLTETAISCPARGRPRARARGSPGLGSPPRGIWRTRSAGTISPRFAAQTTGYKRGEAVFAKSSELETHRDRWNPSTRLRPFVFTALS